MLANALRHLDGGKTQQACNLLAAFVDQANEKIAGGVLGEAAGADLIAQVEAVSGQLECTPVGSPSGAFLD